MVRCDGVHISGVDIYQISFHNIIDTNRANLCHEVAVKMCAPNQLLTDIFALFTTVNL